MSSADVIAMEVHTAHLMHMIAWVYRSISDEVVFCVVLVG
tara:strand:- start:11454 stop:11573 length:120 start_codon:yes stop_codon:yes gene_type:complete